MPPYPSPHQSDSNSSIDSNYTWGHPELYLIPLELKRANNVKAKVKATLKNWHNVPQILWPIAEDLTYLTPGWMPQNNLFSKDDSPR